MKRFRFVLVILILSSIMLGASCVTINPSPAQAPAPSPTATPTPSPSPTPSSTPTPTGTLPKLPSIQTFVAPENVPPVNPLEFVTARQQIDQTFVKLFGETYYANHPNLVNYYEPHDIGKLTQAVQDLKNLTKWEYKANYFDCSNMSGLTQYALHAAGFETLIVVGYDIAAGERHGHAWVVVILQSQSGVKLIPVETTATGGPTIVGNGERSPFKLGNEVHYQTHDDYISQGYAMQDIYQAEEYSPGDFNWWNSCPIDRSWFARGTVSTTPTPTPTPVPTPTPTPTPVPTPTPTPTPAPTPTPTLVTRSATLFDKSITIPAGNFYSGYFDIDPSHMLNPKVAGSFQASGGANNDIDAYIMSQAQYTNWLAGQRATGVYVSGRVTSATFKVAIIASGRYYLVFSNDFSIVSNKVVSAKVILTWQEYQ